MAKYYYDRYYATYNSNPVTYSLSWVYTGQPRGKLIDCYDGYSFNSSTGALSASGSLYAEIKANRTAPGYVFYMLSGSALVKYVCVEAVDPVTWDSYNSSISSSSGGGYYSRGSYITTVIAENGTYPSNSRHSDGYWYVRGSIYYDPPTTPSSITIPTEIKGEESFTISWGSSSYQTGYRLERQLNGGSWVQISQTTGTAYTDTIDKGTLTVNYRVKSYGSGGESGYRTGTVRTVINFPEIFENVGGTFVAFEGAYENVNGVWVEIDSVWENINGIWIEL